MLLGTSKLFNVLVFNYIFKSKENQISSDQLLLGLLFTVGLFTFSFESPSGDTQSVSLVGLGYTVLSFGMDGLVSYFQGQTRSKSISAISSFSYMQIINFWCLLVFSAHLLLSKSSFEGLCLLYDNPKSFVLILQVSLVDTFGEFFTFNLVNLYGPITLALVCTIRKIISILLSIYVYSHPITAQRIIGMTIIFMVLIADASNFRISRIYKKLVFVKSAHKN
jgi:UDP-galactose transporter B1